MSGSDKREAARVPIALRIRLRYADRDTFISKFSANISRSGMFINTRSPKPAGTELRFEMRLRDNSPIITGEGVVRWTRPYDPSMPRRPHGMGIQFTSLSEDSRELIDEVVARKLAAGGAERDGEIPLSNRAPTTPDIAPEPAAAPAPVASRGEADRAALLSTPLDRFDAEVARAIDGDVPGLDAALARAQVLATAAGDDHELAGLLRGSAASGTVRAVADRAATVVDRAATVADRAATVPDDPPGARAEQNLDEEPASRTADMVPEPTVDEPFNVDHSIGDVTDVVPMDPAIRTDDEPDLDTAVDPKNRGRRS